jgi:hypothetical protein
MKFKVCLILMLSTSCTLTAQEVDSVFLKEGELSFSDSLTVFRLIDSLMNLESVEASQLALRVGYNSNVLSAGRTLGIEQFGLAPGISYYHKTGLFADVTTYWSKDYDPNLYLTTISAGYMHIFSQKFSAIASYDHYFYHQLDDDIFVPYTNAVTVSPNLDLKPFTFRLDYSFYFGDAYANRITPGISVNLKKKNFMGFDRVSFYPSFYLLMGDETITEFELVEPKTARELLDNWEKYRMRYSIQLTERNVFGIMNYAFTLPVNFSIKNWLFNLSYTYSIPQALEGEPLTLEESGFISAGLTFYIDLTPVKMKL